MSYLVEGGTDQPVVERILAEVGATPALRLDAKGKPNLDPKVAAICRAASPHDPWFILRDADRDAPDGCNAALLEKLYAGSGPVPDVILRLAVRAMESWLLADASSFGRYFKVSPSKVPVEPDTLDDPKRSLVDLCRSSRRPEIVKGMVPRASAGRSVGPRYQELIGDFTLAHWRPNEARRRSPSLDRAIARLAEYVGTA